MIRVLFLAALLLAGLGQPLLAWGRQGHRALCHIAWQEMDAETRSRVGALLLEGGQVETFEEGCLFADQVRDPEPSERFAPDTLRHYVNVPEDAVGLDLARDCPERCVLEAIGTYALILAQGGTEDRTATEALLMLSHFVGDLHQPLHVGFSADRGGNDIPIRWQGDDPECEPTDWGRRCRYNLHSVWDTWMIESYLDELPRSSEGLPAWQTWAAALGSTITAAERAEWTEQTVLDWADESASFTLQTIYPIAPNSILDKDYAARHRTFIENRIRQAGVRLATLLDAALN